MITYKIFLLFFESKSLFCDSTRNFYVSITLYSAQENEIYRRHIMNIRIKNIIFVAHTIKPLLHVSKQNITGASQEARTDT